MNDEIQATIYVSIVVVVVTACFTAGVLVGGRGGEIRERTRWQEEAIERGVAGYNETTGEWQWKDSEEEK